MKPIIFFVIGICLLSCTKPIAIDINETKKFLNQVDILKNLPLRHIKPLVIDSVKFNDKLILKAAELAKWNEKDIKYLKG